MGVDLRNKPNLFPLRFTSNVILFIRCFLILIVKFLCRFNLTMAQTNADDDLKSKSLKAEFASVNSVGNKQEEFGRSFCIAVKRLQHIKGLLNVLLQKRYDEATYGGKFIDGTILR
ncbi:hypothetical protein YC2023_114138 [Brassica napus]